MGYISQSIGKWQDFTPSFTGFSADPSVTTARYTVNGKLCTVQLFTGQGTSNATTFTVTLPFNAKYLDVFGGIVVVDNSAAQTNPGRAQTSASSNVLTITKTHTGSSPAWTASGGKAAWFTITYEIE